MVAEVVLIVDDNDKNVRLARDVLRHAGFLTIEASSGREGFAAAVTHQPDVILMDIRLPDVDGTEIVRQLRAEPRTRRIPVIAVTAYAMKGDRERFLEAGFDGYLEKPVSIKELPAQVDAYCRREETR